MNRRQVRCLLELWEWQLAGAVSLAAVVSLVAFLGVAALQHRAQPVVQGDPGSAGPNAHLVGLHLGGAVPSRQMLRPGAPPRPASGRLLEALPAGPSRFEACDPMALAENRPGTVLIAAGVVLLWLASLMLIGNPLEPLRRPARVCACH